jgi:hypothetical protein
MIVWAVLAAASMTGAVHAQQLPVEKPGSALVIVAGCAKATAQPHIWTLSDAGARVESATVAITTEEKERLAAQPPGQNTYQLIGVADFVDGETSRKIGVRGKILTAPRVNATGMLADGHKVGVKGLYIDARPPRINLTSVVDLAARCP